MLYQVTFYFVLLCFFYQVRIYIDKFIIDLNLEKEEIDYAKEKKDKYKDLEV